MRVIDAVSRTRPTGEAIQSRAQEKYIRVLALGIGFTVAALATVFGAIGQSPLAGALPWVATAIVWETVSIGLFGIIALLFSASARDDRVMIGYASIGVFTLLGLFIERAFLPAVVFVSIGGIIATASSLPTDRDPATYFGWITGIGLVGGTTVSMFGAAGLEPAILRPAGGMALFAGLVLLPVWLDSGQFDVAAGAFVAAFVWGVSAVVPVITETVLLSGLSVVGVPVLLVALGVGGAATAIVRSLRRRRPTTALGIGLVLTAGAPAALPTATAALLGTAVIATREGTRNV